MRVTPRDANYPGSESRFCILRPELIASFYQVSQPHNTTHNIFHIDSQYFIPTFDLVFCLRLKLQRGPALNPKLEMQ